MVHKHEPRGLPGEPGLHDDAQRMLRVNHAGEYGARRIYAGQLFVLKGKEGEGAIRHMAEQEEKHFAVFDKMLAERRVRPTALMPLWHVAGFVLGAATALLGKNAAMACTVAVESVIDEHYAQQEERLGENDPELKHNITQFRAEEKEHHDTALAEGAEQAPLYPVLSSLVSGASRVAIWLSTRV